MAVIDHVKNAIANIVLRNEDKIDMAYDAKGGMEGWFQVELLYELSVQELAVEREVDVPDVGRCDFEISDDQETIYVELKVETNNQDMSDAYEADRQKIDLLRSTDQIGYAVLVAGNTYSGAVGEPADVHEIENARGNISCIITY